jgi:two-component system sensor histidine kinase KdpD
MMFEKILLYKGLSHSFKNHILIMIEGNGHSEALVRAGCRIAENRQANWTVVVFSHDTQIMNKQENSQSREIERALNLTRQMGGMTEVLHGQHAKTLFDYVMDRGISTLVLAQAAPQKFSLNLRLNLIDQLLQYRPSFELSIVPIIAEISICPFSLKGHSCR